MFTACVFALAIAVAPPVLAQEAVPPVAFWTMTEGVLDKKESENLSGAACYIKDEARKSCLLMGDEKRYARFFTIDGTTIKPQGKVMLLPEKDPAGKDYDETDVEGVDFEGGYYYLVGSHGLPKKAKTLKDEQASRYFIYRFKVRDDTGLPDFKVDGNGPAPQVERSGKLRDIIARTPPLDRYAREFLDRHGVNIEGLAVRNGQIYLGFRGPSLDGTAYIMRIAVDALFGDVPPQPKVFPVKLGQGMGVRDLAKVPDGFLVLTGPEEDTSGAAVLFFWNDGAEATALRRLKLVDEQGKPVEEEAKPEALLLLGTAGDGYRVLILHDGPAGGKPTEYRIPAK